MSRGSIGRFLGRLAYEIAEEYVRFAKLGPRPIQSKGEAPQTPFFVQSVNEEWHHEEKQHRQEERDFWRKSLNYTALAGLAATVAAGFSIGAFYQAARQARAAEEANRPWVQIESAEIEQLGYQSAYQWIAGRISVRVKNSGHSPAIRVSVISRLLLGTAEAFFEGLTARKVCEEAVYEPDDGVGVAVFPGLSKPVSGPVSRKMDSIAKVLRSRDHDQSLDFEKARRSLNLIIAGCVLYKDNSDTIRKAAFYADLPRINAIDDGPFLQNLPLTLSERAGGYVE